MLNFFDKLIKSFSNKQKNILLNSNDRGTITMKFEILYSILDYILKDYTIFENADIEFDEIDKSKNLYRLFIITKNNLKDISENKLKIIKKKIMTEFKENGFNLINVIITSEEKLEDWYND